MSNIQELKAAANRSTMLANDVCNVLGACEKRLQQLETSVLPLYGDTARLQHIHHNMERTAKALDHVINYYMVARELADLITAGPLTSSPESLNVYLEALDKLAEAQKYFNINNPNSVELENINTLYNNGVVKLENAFEELLSRNTRPLSPSTLMDMIALEEDSGADSASAGGSGPLGAGPLGAGAEALRAAAGWLSAAGRAPAAALAAARAPAARASLAAFKDYLRTRSMGASPLLRAKNLLNRSDSNAKKTSKIQKVFEKRANKIMMKASQTLEQSTGFAIGPRKSLSESYTDESGGEGMEEYEAEAIGELAACLCRIARNEQRCLLGLVPLQRLPALLAAVLKDCFAILATDVERAGARWRRAAARCAGAAPGWALRGRLARLQPEAERALAPAPPAPFLAVLHSCHQNCVRSLEEWVEGMRGEGGAGVPVDGTVHQLAAAALALLQNLAEHAHVLGPALATEPSYARALSQLSGVHDRNAAVLAIYMRKVLATLNLTLRSKSEQHPEALKAIFRLNNSHYLLQGLQRSGLLDVLMIVEPECEITYRNMIEESKQAYLQSWNKLLAHTVFEEALPPKLRDRDRQMLKDKFSAFNRELEEASRAARRLSVPAAELRAALRRATRAALLAPYARLHGAAAAAGPFAKHPDKYVKYTPDQVAAMLDGYFDEAA